MEFFATVFGEYPFIGEKYGMFSTFTGPAVEEQTMTAYPQVLINGGHSYDWLLVHELAHMWWGDCLTCQNWAEVWLNEGFASYAEALWREHLYGSSSYRNYMINMDGGPYAGSIYDPPYVWHSIVYDKGAWILHMLRNILGDSDFFQFLLDYRAVHEYSNVVTEDLVAIAENLSGGDLDWFFEPWIYHEGRPYYHWGWTYSGPPYTLRLSIAQVQSPDYPTYTMPIDVEVTTVSGTQNFVVWDSLRYQSFDLALLSEPTGVTLDPEVWILGDFEEVETSVPAEKAGPAFLAQNTPNPFNPATQIRFGSSRSGRVSLRVFDLQGRMLRTLLAGHVEAGEHIVRWNGKNDAGEALASGVYLYRLVGPDGVRERKMTLLR
jgi:aminopeptidase N